MYCERCKKEMNIEFIDDEPKIVQTRTARVRHECPSCFLRVYRIIREAKKL